MEKRHDDELTSRLERILTDGSAFISWNELYLWYGVQKLSVASYRDLANRWKLLAEQKDSAELGELAYVQSPTRNSPGIHVFGSAMPQPLYER